MLLAAALQLVSLFPHGAQIIETRTVRKARVIVLWMISPTRDPNPCPRLEDWGDSCPDRTQGCHFHGPTRVSLVDTSVPRIMNTIAIDDPWTGEDAFDIPYKVMTPGPYRFDRRTRRPTILSLRDYNGDGKPLEFALFQALTCSDLLCTLLGYSEKRDAIIQYSVRVQYDGPGPKTEDYVTDWPDHLYDIKPIRPRFWRYVLVYPPGPPEVPWEHWTVRYVPSREEFVAHCVATMKR
jgi:hypothetical protein